MRKTIGIISKAVFAAVLGVLIGLTFTTETKAAHVITYNLDTTRSGGKGCFVQEPPGTADRNDIVSFTVNPQSTAGNIIEPYKSMCIVNDGTPISVEQQQDGNWVFKFQMPAHAVDVTVVLVKKFEIAYRSNNGKDEAIRETAYYGIDYSIAKRPKDNKNWTYSGYEFTGWNEEEDGSGEHYNEGQQVQFQGGVELFAEWKPAGSESKKRSLPKCEDEDDSCEDDTPSVEKPFNPYVMAGVSFTGTPAGVVKLGQQSQGAAAQLEFRMNTPVGWKEAFSFNMTVNDKADVTRKQGVLSFRIPSQYLKTGRTFAILGIDKDGNVKLFADTDTDPGTITVNIDIEGYAFDLIYIDNQ